MTPFDALTYLAGHEAPCPHKFYRGPVADGAGCFWLTCDDCGLNFTAEGLAEDRALALKHKHCVGVLRAALEKAGDAP